MAHRSKPPRGYKASEYPLPHNFQYVVGLDLAAENKNDTIMTIVRGSDTVNAPSTIEVHPENETFAEETGALCNHESIIDKMSINMHIGMTNHSIQTDQIGAINLYYMPITGAFLEAWNPEDKKSTNDVGEILRVTDSVTQQEVVPTFSGTKLGTGTSNQPLSTINDTETIAMYGLSTTAVMEGVDFVEDTLWDSFQYYTIHGKMAAVTGTWRKLALSTRRPTINIHMNRFVPRSVRRINPYTYFGMLIYMPLAGSFNQPSARINEVNTGVHVMCNMAVRYNEWNQEFHQGMM